MQPICCEYGSGLLMLEADDDIVEELGDVAEDRLRSMQCKMGTEERPCLLRQLPAWTV